jgi:hypothetical protein
MIRSLRSLDAIRATTTSRSSNSKAYLAMRQQDLGRHGPRRQCHHSRRFTRRLRGNGQPRWLEEQGRYPHPATYLNQRRWEDEQPGPQAAGVTARTAGNLTNIARGLGLTR